MRLGFLLPTFFPQAPPFLSHRHHRSLRHLLRGRLNFVRDQPAQKRIQHHKRDAHRETARAELSKKLHVRSVSRDDRRAGRLGNHAREIAGKE